MQESIDFDIVCVGDAIIDAFLSLHDANTHCKLNDKSRELCFECGGKIPLDDCQFLLGGNGANVSVGLSRLGYKTGLMAEIGTDEFSEKIKKSLEKEKVDHRYIQQTENAQSTFSVIINFLGERTIFTKHVKRAHKFPLDQIQSNWLYLTSLGKEWRHVYEEVFNLVSSKKWKLAFNPGVLQLDEGREEIIKLLSKTEILFVNKEEALRISNFQFPISNEITNEKIIIELLKNLQKLGTKNVVITDGMMGSYAIDEKGLMLYCNIYESLRIEMTGAGDAYATGALGALIYGGEIIDAMKLGTINAASVVGKIGAQPGLLTIEEM